MHQQRGQQKPVYLWLSCCSGLSHLGNIAILIFSAKGGKFPFQYVNLSAEIWKNYWLNFHETLWMDKSLAKKDPVTFLNRFKSCELYINFFFFFFFFTFKTLNLASAK